MPKHLSLNRTKLDTAAGCSSAASAGKSGKGGKKKVDEMNCCICGFSSNNLKVFYYQFSYFVKVLALTACATSGNGITFPYSISKEAEDPLIHNLDRVCHSISEFQQETIQS